MDVYEIRKLRLRLLIRAHGGLIKTVAERVGTDPNHLSAILSEKSKAQMGNDLARRFDEAFDMPPGWMDSSPDSAVAEILNALPDHDEKEILFITRLKLTRATETIEPATLARYLNMIDEMLLALDIKAAEPPAPYVSK